MSKHHNGHYPFPECISCSALQFRVLAEQMPDIVIHMNDEARFLYVNSRIRDLFDMDAEFFTGKTCLELGMSQQCASLWEQIAKETLSSGSGVDREVELHVSGSMQNLHIRTACDKTTHLKTFIATVRNITTLRRHERQIQELAQRLTYHVNNTPLAVMEWTPDGKCLTWNGEAEDMFGWSRRELKKNCLSPLDLVHTEDQAGFRAILERLAQGRVVSDFTKCRVLQREGSLLFCECHLSALLDSDGQAKSILWVASDVTHRELAEQEMQQLNSGLEERIRQRTAQLSAANEELQREILARKVLEKELISISEREHRRVGHDLHDGVCQELSGVRFSLEAISKKRRKGTVLRDQLDKLTAAIERAVHHIRLLSRGLAPLELEDGSLASALEDLAATTTSLFQIKCWVKCRGRSQKLEIEKAINLFRIAQEAIQNAIKHGDASEIRLDLDLLHGVLSITDNGNGIKHDAPSPARGNGMGLKIMRHRAEQIHGTVTLDHPPSGGVRVTCNFPK
ncbi:MAG: PAS domain S-box protein [bacterium]